MWNVGWNVQVCPICTVNSVGPLRMIGGLVYVCTYVVNVHLSSIRK